MRVTHVDLTQLKQLESELEKKKLLAKELLQKMKVQKKQLRHNKEKKLLTKIHAMDTLIAKAQQELSSIEQRKEVTIGLHSKDNTVKVSDMQSPVHSDVEMQKIMQQAERLLTPKDSPVRTKKGPELPQDEAKEEDLESSAKSALDIGLSVTSPKAQLMTDEGELLKERLNLSVPLSPIVKQLAKKQEEEKYLVTITNMFTS